MVREAKAPGLSQMVNRPKIRQYAETWHITVAADRTGPLGLKHTWCLARVDEWKPAGLLGAVADPDVILLPNKRFAERLDADVTNLVTRLTAFGIVGLSATADTTVRQIIRRLGRRHNPDLEPENIGPLRGDL
jgi:hypothetical protein